MNSIATSPVPPGGTPSAPSPGAGALSRPAPAPQPPVHRTDAASAPTRAQQQHLAARELQRQIDEALADSRVQTSLRFRVDEEASRIVVSVLDADSGELILQIPDDAALAMARRLARSGSGLLDHKA